MTSVRQLYALQELDLVLDQLRNRQQVAEEELQTEVSIGVLERALESETERITEVQLQQRHNQLEFESHRERSQVLETWLYDGSITNARDLENIQQGIGQRGPYVGAGRSRLARPFDSGGRVADQMRRPGPETHRDTGPVGGRRDELQQILQELAGQLGGYEDQRQKVADAVDPASLQRYETLRRSKNGVAVVKVARGLCQGCQMALPTQLNQKVRSGRQQVICTSCGRLLIVS